MHEIEMGLYTKPGYTWVIAVNININLIETPSPKRYTLDRKRAPRAII